MNNTRSSRPFVLFTIIYVTMFLFGLVENVKGVSFPLIKTEFGVAYDSQGGMVSLTWFGYVIFCLAASLFLQRFGIKNSILAGYLLVCMGAAATLAAPSFWLVTLTLLGINAGFGFYEVGANALASIVFTRRTALMMNLMHFFYGFGAILGPKTAGLLTDELGLSWRQVYTVVMIPTAVVFFLILFTKIRAGISQGVTGETSSKLTFLRALRDPLVLLFCLTLGFMEVIEFGAANWGGLYLKDVYGLDPRVFGASFVSLFYILFTFSRLLGGPVVEKIGDARSLFLALAGSIGLFTGGFALGRNGVWVLPFTGLFIGVMWPTLMAYAMRVFGANAPIITSVIITVSGAVNGVFQFIIGLTNFYAGESWGYRSCLFYSVVAVIVLYTLSRRIREPKKWIPQKA